MSNINPKVTIIVPCFNQGVYLYDALQSIFCQTYTNWECIIINDGSTDNTEQIAMYWCVKDERFSYVTKKNGGLSSARNYGIRISKGDYILFLDSDDFLSINKIKLSIDYFKLDSKLDIVINDFKIYDSKKREYLDPNFKLGNFNFNFSTILFDWDIKFTIPIHCAIFKKNSFKGLLFNENLSAKEDWVFWCAYFYYNPKVIFLKSYESFYRANGSGITSNFKLMFENKLLAYNVLLDFIPKNYTLRFSKKCIESISSECFYFYNENVKFKNTRSYIFIRIERFLKRKLNI